MAARGLTRRVYALVAGSLSATAAAALLRLYYGVTLPSRVLLVEGLHALLDAVLTLLVLGALVVSRSRWARRFPYGLYRLEDLVAVILAMLILLELADQVGGVFAPPPPPSALVTLVEAASIAPLAIAVWLKWWAGVEARSPGLRADAMHMVVDVVESGGVAAGLALYQALGVPLAYRAAYALALGGLALAAYEAARDSVLALLDLPREPELVERALELARAAAGNRAEIVSVRLRWAGPVVFAEIEARLHPLLTIDAGSRIASRIADALRRGIEGVEDVTVKLLPSVRKHLLVAVPLDEPSREARPSRHFSRAPYMLLARVEGRRVTDTRIVETRRLLGEAARREQLVGAELAEKLHELGVTDVVVENIGELAYALLLRHRILVWRADPAATAQENVEKLARGTLEPLEEPTHEAPWRTHTSRLEG